MLARLVEMVPSDVPLARALTSRTTSLIRGTIPETAAARMSRSMNMVMTASSQSGAR